MAKKVGRPTLYKSEYCEKLIEFFDKEPYSEKLLKKVTKQGDVIEIPTNVPSDFPTLAGFAIELGVSRDTLQEWAKVHPEFSVAYKRAKDFQERYLTVNGIKGLIQPAFSIFTAKNVIDWRDRSEIEGSFDSKIKHDPQDIKMISEFTQIAKTFIEKNK